MVVGGVKSKARKKYDSTNLIQIKFMGGISNIQIENAFKKINDPDLLDNFVGVFASNYKNKFVNHAVMILVNFRLL